MSVSASLSRFSAHQTLKKVYAGLLDPVSSLKVPSLQTGQLGEAAAWLRGGLATFQSLHSQTESSSSFSARPLTQLQGFDRDSRDLRESSVCPHLHLATLVEKHFCSLSPEDPILFPLGYHSSQGRQDLVAELRRSTDEKVGPYSLRIFNTGLETESFHEVSIVDGKRVLRSLDFERLTAPTVVQLARILEPLFPSRKQVKVGTAGQLYGRLFQYFMKEGNVRLGESYIAHEQGSGYYQSVAAWLQARMGETSYAQFDYEWSKRAVEELGDLLNEKSAWDFQLEDEEGTLGSVEGSYDVQLPGLDRQTIRLQGPKLVRLIHGLALEQLQTKRELSNPVRRESHD